MIDLSVRRTLRMATPAEEGRPSFVAAASGAVHHRGVLYVVADDEQSLACFPDGAPEGQWTRLLGGELPLDPALRKSVKADLETLTLLPPFGGAPHGALFALGSGSHPRRRWGVLLRLGEEGRPVGVPQKVDLQPLYEALRTRVGTLNIEGALVLGGQLLLLQRGTVGRAGNALVLLHLARALGGLEARTPWGPELLLQVQPVELPMLEGAALGFTDGIALGDDRILFTAAAERTGDPYHDGPCDGSVIGAVTREGRLLGYEAVRPAVKLEGLALVGDRLWLVSDGDNPELAAVLYEAALPGFGR